MHIMVDKDEYALLLEEHRRMKNIVRELFKELYKFEDVFRLRDIVSADPYLKELFKKEMAKVVAE